MNNLRVGDKYRRNTLSIKPGGTNVVVSYTNGTVYIYDKIKHPQAYINSVIRRGHVIDAWIEGSRPTPESACHVSTL